MNCQIKVKKIKVKAFFSGKNITLSSAELAHRVVMVPSLLSQLLLEK